MRALIEGVDVTVVRPTEASADPYGAPVPGEPAYETVGDVLVDSPSTSDLEETARAYGVSCTFVLRFPKSYGGSLRGCSVELPTPWSCTAEVQGDPMPLMERNTPGRWNRDVRVVRTEG